MPLKAPRHLQDYEEIQYPQRAEKWRNWVSYLQYFICLAVFVSSFFWYWTRVATIVYWGDSLEDNCRSVGLTKGTVDFSWPGAVSVQGQTQNRDARCTLEYSFVWESAAQCRNDLNLNTNAWLVYPEPTTRDHEGGSGNVILGYSIPLRLRPGLAVSCISEVPIPQAFKNNLNAGDSGAFDVATQTLANNEFSVRHEHIIKRWNPGAGAWTDHQSIGTTPAYLEVIDAGILDLSGHCGTTITAAPPFRCTDDERQDVLTSLTLAATAASVAWTVTCLGAVLWWMSVKRQLQPIRPPSPNKGSTNGDKVRGQVTPTEVA
ncbi:unnamed protein product [Pedinophyceae sp. YPF-701]|nr:unnamed protein product [Pedinophyceae sp. YPF-701]